MTIKEARKQIRILTKEAIKANQYNKIDKITRKIEILKDFIMFELEVNSREN